LNLLDTNIFLELLLDQKRAGECERLLEFVSKGTIEAVVTHFTVHAIEACLGSGKNLEAFLRNLQHFLGLFVYDTNISDEISLVSKKIDRDFDDTLQYYVAKKLGVDSIVTFDEHFDGLDIDRVEPNDLLRKPIGQHHESKH
jgi:predicted nucleic acid-binding protein